jgi:HK97 family phage major capsid protein
MKEIRALARQFDKPDLGDAAIDNGVSVDNFRAQLLGSIGKNPAMRASESPEIGMSERDVSQYSFTRALLAASDPMNAAKLAPFEYECSRAAQDQRGDVRAERQAALTIPVDVLSRGMSIGNDAASSAMRMMSGRRDLTAGSMSGGGNTISTNLLSGSFIEMLRNAMVLDQLGATFLTGLNGNIAIPSQTGTATSYWVDESGSPTESQQTVGQVTMTPKTVGAFTDYSRRLLLQSSIDVEAFVRADLAAIIGLAIQNAALNGTGGNMPTGVLNASGIGAIIGGTNGAAPTYDHLIDMTTIIDSANADMGNLGFLTNSQVRGKLRKTPVMGNAAAMPVWGLSDGINNVAGYQSYVTNAIPSDLVKGSSSACSAIIFGNWADLMIGMWGGLDIMLDPYTGATSGTKRVVALQDVDVALRRVASFAVMKDALTA